MKGSAFYLLVVGICVLLVVTEGCGRRKRRRPPPNRSPSISCPPVNDVIAPPLSTKTAVSWSSPSVSDDRGGWSLRQIAGGHSGSVFPEGRHTITYKVVDSGGRTSTCSFSFRVKVVRCSYHIRPQNGKMDCSTSDNIYGRTCTFSCDDGHWLDGNSLSTCQSNGENSHATPSCKKKQCGEINLPFMSTGADCTDERYYGSVCLLLCNRPRGYEPRYFNLAKCLANTTWKYQNWECEDTEKPKILNCPEGRLETSNITYVWPTIHASDNSGNVTLTQKRGQPPGSRLKEGVQIIEYNAVDSSDNTAPVCVFSVIYEYPQCAEPVYGGGEYDPHFICNGHKVGDSCRANCTYSRVVGAKYIQCQRTGSIIPSSKWVGFKDPYPKCLRKSCPDLNTPVNGALVCDKFYGGQTCQIHCNENYDVPESMQYLNNLICGSKGWHPVSEVPDCTEMSIPDVYNLPSQLYYFGGDCSDTETHKFIKDRFLENLIASAVDDCKYEKCQIENIEVTCGPIDEDYYEYDDDYNNDDQDYSGETDYPSDSPSRKRRAVTEVPVPGLVWTQTPEVNGVKEEDDDFEYSKEGSGDVVRRRKKKPSSRTVVNFILAVRNTSRTMTDEKVVDILGKILNSTRSTLNGTLNFMGGPQGNLTFTCGPGKVPSNISQSHCVSCPRGTFHNKEIDICESCPAGSYLDITGQTACKPCDLNYGTENNGSTSPEDCKPACPPGQFSKSGLIPCTLCQLGTFQPDHFGKQCTPCPADSSTAEMGSSSFEQCVPFDVMAKGPVHLELGPVTSDWVEELTMTFWIRTLPIRFNGHVNISLILSHPTRGHQMTVELTHQTHIKMRDDQVPVHAFIPQDLWTHVAVVWKGYPSYVDIYVGGKRVEHYSGYTPLCFLPNGTELKIEMDEASSATLREVYIIPKSNTSRIIADMARSCTPENIGYESLIRKMVSSDSSKISLVTPSVCSAIDRCSPNPCPDHYCRSFKYGFDCVCMGGYSGETCTIPPDYCVLENMCQNDAVCKNIEDGINCTCTEDFKGKFCDTLITHGSWGSWTAWSECTLTCGGGVRSRSRECNNPVPEPNLGKPCSGPSVEESVCNLNRCPECKTSQLTLGRGINSECVSVTRGFMNCSITCDPGLVFPEDPPSYICQEEVWVPESKTISCVEFSIPDNVGFTYTVPYKTRLTNKEEDKIVIRDQASVCASKTSCVMEETCRFTASVETCVREEGGCTEFPEGYKATIRFTSDVVRSNWSVEISKANLKEAWVSLNDSYSDLEEMYDDCFRVTLSSGSVKPGTAVLDDDLSCPSGSAPDQGYCSACPPGTRNENKTCIQCVRGWYQQDSGQLACNMCPAAFNTHYTGSSLLSECLPPPLDSFMLLTDPVTGHIWSVNMTSFKQKAVSLPDNVRTSSSGYDPVTEHVFFADKGRPAIHSTGPGSSRTYVKLNWAASVDGIAVDPVSRLIFYTDKGNDVIGVVTMVTKHHKIIIRSGTYMPRHIVVDPNNGVLFWIDWGVDQKIERASYDGTNRQTLVGSASVWPEGLALDLDANKLYWSDGGMKTVEVMDVDGQNRMTLVSAGVNFPSSIALFQDYVFYSAITSNSSIVMRVNKDGTGMGQTELPPFRYISDMHSHRRSDFTSASNGCSTNNGGCTFICFPRPAGNRICACPDGYVMDKNGVDCTKKATKTRWWDMWMKPRHRRHAMLRARRLH